MAQTRKWRLPLDGYSLALLAAVGVAVVLPVRGATAAGLSWVTTAAIALLFFLHGARLSRQTVIAGATHWRLHLLVFGCTFVLFPALGLLVHGLPATVLGPSLATGFLFLTLLPSTVQSSIAFTSMASGNVTAAVCTAAASNLVGTLLTPALVAVFMGVQGHGGDTGAVIRSISLQLLVPFLAGQAVQPWAGAWISRHRILVTMTDRGSILLVVYGAFSAAIVHGLFSQVAWTQLATVFLFALVLLAAVVGTALFLGRRLGFSRADQMTILFCGSTKSLASGVPMAGVLFPAATVGVVILPLMIFHQVQLLVCAQIARHYATRGAAAVGQDAVAREPLETTS